MFSKSWMRLAVPTAAVVSFGGAACADVVFNNGLENDLASAVEGVVVVADNPNGPPFVTSLNFLAGASSTLDLDVTGSSIVRVFAGSSIGDDLVATNSSTVYMTGGSVGDDIRVRNSSVFHLSGGIVSDTVAARENATLYIYGYGFNWDYGAIAAGTGTITGFLSDGTAINYAFDRGTSGNYTGTIALVYAVPSPAGIALLGLAGIFRSRRR